ncbi:MAG: N-acetyltransferase [Cyanobacteria bacterium P01_A01_bin.45]
MSYIIRPLTPRDEPFLWEMLYQALFVPPGTEPFSKQIIYQPELAKYVQDWQASDIGFLAVLESSQIPIGTVWIRLFNNNNPGYGYINNETPELSIAVLAEYRDRGIGTQLILHLCGQIKNRYEAVSLSVSSENPALRLYQRLGFEIVAQLDNSLTMKKQLK